MQYTVFKHRTFDVKGLGTQGAYTLQMEQVFVDLSIVAQPTHNLSSNILGSQVEAVPGRRYSIHDLLSPGQSQYQTLAVIGPPGSGKTTLLRHVALTLGQKQLPRFPAGVLRGLFFALALARRNAIPVLLSLREHAELICKASAVDIATVIDESLRHTSCVAPKHWFKRRLRNGRCLVMLDGLDEIADPGSRRKVVSWLETQLDDWAHNRFLITSRPFGYKSNPLSRATVFEVRPFSPQQITQFVHNWYLANEVMAAGHNDEGVCMAASTGAEDLLGRLQRTRDLAELAVNPLLLTMIATVHRFKSSLPGRRVELYSEMCDVFLGNRQRAKNVQGVDLMPAQKRRVLEPLAYQLMCGKARDIPRSEVLALVKKPLAAVSKRVAPEEFIRDIEDLSGVLVERENSVYSFVHLTFQEYLAAAHVRSHHLEEGVLSHIGESWWHEVLLLYSAQGDASPVILACLSNNDPSVEVLTLATQCMDEAFEVKPELRDRLEAVLATTSGDEARRLLAQQRLKLRVRKLLRNEEHFLLDDSLVTNAEYRLFLEESGTEQWPDHWRRDSFALDSASKPVDGVRASDAMAFCVWLTARENNGCTFRLPTTSEATGSPVGFVAERLPFYYWTCTQESMSLASATEFPIVSALNILSTIRADLTFLLDGDLALAGMFERIWETWKLDNLDIDLADHISKLLSSGPTIDLDTTMSWANQLRSTGDESDLIPKLVGVTFLATNCELSRGISTWRDHFAKAAVAALAISPSSHAEVLGIELLVRLVDALSTSGPLAVPTKMVAARRGQLRGAIGAALQGNSHREAVAKSLSLIFAPHLRNNEQRLLTWHSPSQHRTTEAHAYRLRALIRMLALTMAWALTIRMQDQTISTGSTDYRVDAGRCLLQTFIDLSLLEGRISGKALGAESIRIAREMNTEMLETLYQQEERLQLAVGDHSR